MQRRSWTLAFIAALLVGVGGVAAWISTHNGYPNTVYYRKGVTTYSGGSSMFPPNYWEQWDDPRGHAQFYLGHQGTLSRCITVWRGTVGECTDRWNRSDLAMNPQKLQSYSQFWHGLQQGGFSAIGQEWLHQADSSVTHLHVFSHRALLFHTKDAGRIWLDEAADVPIQQQWIDPFTRATVTMHFLRAERLPAGSLPSDFFERAGAPRSLWEQTLGWLQNHFKRRS